MAHILVIDDDDDLLKMIDQALKTRYQITLMDNTKDMDTNCLSKYDLLILDVMMPEKNGFEFLRENRYLIDAPVLFLTARDFEEDKLEGFASGADDYITKPFSIKELRARVEAHLRREQREKQFRLTDGQIECDLIQKKFFINRKTVALTASEFEICLFLLRHKGQVFAKEDIYTSVYGFDATGDSQTSITERIKQIRNKFAKYEINPIQTVWGVGYQWQNIPL